MGNILSRNSTSVSKVEGEIFSESETMACTNSSVDNKDNDINEEEFHETDEFQPMSRAEEMTEFHRQLEIKRELRREVLARHREEKINLKKSLELERIAKQTKIEENKVLRELLQKNNIVIPDFINDSEVHNDFSTMIKEMKVELGNLNENNKRLRTDLAESNLSLQNANSDIANLMYQNVESMKQINALKEVITVSKTMINLREQQLNELKEKLTQIEKSLADRETNLLSTDLRQEYERQLQNIRTLRGLYEERARLAEVTRLNLLSELEEQKTLHSAEVNRCNELTSKIEELDQQVTTLTENIEGKNDLISSCQEETRGLKAEMSTINKLFSQVLIGYKGKQNWDQLVHRLEENHGLLVHMVERDDGSESSSALPKLLLELVNQVEDCDNKNNNVQDQDVNKDSISVTDDNIKSEATELQAHNASAEEIVKNLPKVWKVLMELLSHQNTNELESSEKVTTCYKTVETLSGSVLVPSVSQTYIRLKDLILEKLTLIKEVNKMKQLNTHLESRLEEQERRLCLVTSELSKTWHVVGRLRRHHHQLHTHEKILKYELQQKRKLLNELKDELEYCREKWEKAREKNTQSEKDWKKLRAEFSSRKTKTVSPSFNNSAESGYSDERQSDESSESNDESEYINGLPLRNKKKLKTFDNILDSSADFNLAAEREDPISDMLDVADLPLDSQEIEEGVERPGTSSAQMITEDIDMSECSQSDNVMRSNCEETEDEVGDIGTESQQEEQNVNLCCENNSPGSKELNTECSSQLKAATVKMSNTVEEDSCDVTDNGYPKENIVAFETETQVNADSHTIVTIDPATILKNIKAQNERLAKKDKALELLEQNSSTLLKKTQDTIKCSEQINIKLDHLLNRPSTSNENNNTLSSESNDNNVKSHCEPNTPLVSIVDAKQILENIKMQNERLAKKDERFKRMESGCNEVINNITKTLNTGQQIEEKLNTIHNKKYANEPEIAKELVQINVNKETSSNDTNKADLNEPTTSRTDVDHETRLAAREERLKRLEEQTKSLVNKVNKTKTKGVKINYKLEELHNIYGSENSRAGTPFEENEEDSNEE